MEELQRMSNEQVAYLAGIIDGEGYIGLNQKSPGRYELCLAVKSTCLQLLDWLHQRTGSRPPRDIPDNRPLVGGGVRSPVREWRVFGDHALEVLLAVRLHLIVKREQARLGISYQDQTPEERRATGAQYHTELMQHNGRQARLRANGIHPQPPTE